MDATASISSETSHSSSSSKSLQENLATTCVGSPGQLRALLNRLVHYQQRAALTFSLTAINTLYYFMRCSQVSLADLFSNVFLIIFMIAGTWTSTGSGIGLREDVRRAAAAGRMAASGERSCRA